VVAERVQFMGRTKSPVAPGAPADGGEAMHDGDDEVPF
jgi:hypothetical protein